jgi:hypothetical protein
MPTLSWLDLARVSYAVVEAVSILLLAEVVVVEVGHAG